MAQRVGGGGGGVSTEVFRHTWCHITSHDQEGRYLTANAVRFTVIQLHVECTTFITSMNKFMGY